MSRNGAGTYSLYTPGNPVVTGTVISSTTMNNTLNDIASALTDSIAKDGQTTLTANLPMGGHKLTGLAAGTTAGDSVRYEQLQAVNVKDFGAVGDGATANYAAFAAAIAYCKLTGRTLYIPAGNYLINTDSGSLTLEYVNILGEGVIDGNASPVNAGSVLSFTGTTNPAILLQRGVTIDGIAIYYPNQTDSATPTAYPPTIQVDITDGPVNFCYIRNCTVFNAYRFFVDTDTGGNIGHIFIDDNAIYGILTCFEISHNAEVISWKNNNFTFGVWADATEGGCRGYTRANGSVFKIIRTDGFTASGNLCFGYLNGFNFVTAATICQYANIENNLFDQTLFPITASGTGNLTLSQIVGNTFIAFNSQSTATAGNAISVSTSGALATEILTIVGNGFASTTREHILVSGNTPIRQLLISANSFTSWAAYVAAGGPYASVSVTGASTSVSIDGNTFTSQNAAYTSGVLGTCSTAVISNNTFGACVNAISATYNSVLICGNYSYSTSGTYSDVVGATVINSTGNMWDKPSGSTTRPAFLVRKAASQTTSGTTPLTEAFGTTVYDKGTNFSSTTFTAPAAGRYRFEWSLCHDNTGTAGDRFSIVLTASAGGVLSTSYKMIADYNTVTGGGELQLAAAATVTLVVTRAAGTGVFATLNDANYNYLCGSLIE